MRFLSFEVEGFKNLVAPVRLDELGAINVLHGENNVGKSNVLRAMEVFFVVLDMRATSSNAPTIKARLFLGSEWLVNRKVRVEDLFNYAVPKPIRMTATLTLEPEEVRRAGIEPPGDVREVSICMTLAKAPGGLAVEVERLRFADGKDLATESPESSAGLVGPFAQFLATRFLGRRRVPRVDVDRRIEAVVDALYDAHVSLDRTEAQQWDRFAEAMSGFNDILGPGRFLPVLPRQTGDEPSKPRLLFETPTMRIPLHALGTGVQQIIALIGAILTSGAAVVFVEEPEVYLRWALQERVREVLAGLVGKEGAPSQLILTSHSGAFETGGSFYLMQRGDPGPTVQRRPVAQAAAIVGRVADTPQTAPEVPTHVSSEGVLRLPERIRTAIGVEQGGGVSFVDKGQGVVEMMADETFLRLAGLGDEDV